MYKLIYTTDEIVAPWLEDFGNFNNMVRENM